MHNEALLLNVNEGIFLFFLLNMFWKHLFFSFIHIFVSHRDCGVKAHRDLVCSDWHCLTWLMPKQTSGCSDGPLSSTVNIKKPCYWMASTQITLPFCMGEAVSASIMKKLFWRLNTDCKDSSACFFCQWRWPLMCHTGLRSPITEKISLFNYDLIPPHL